MSITILSCVWFRRGRVHDDPVCCPKSLALGNVHAHALDPEELDSDDVPALAAPTKSEFVWPSQKRANVLAHSCTDGRQQPAP